MNTTYIIGGGPTGLCVATYLSRTSTNEVIIFEKAKTLGGAHHIPRHFVEHAPRVYSTRYKNTEKWLKDLGIDFASVFVPYHFQISDISGKSFGQFTFSELSKIAFGSLTSSKSVFEYTNTHNFSQKSIEYLNRLCKLTDGMGIDRYPMSRLYELVNQHTFHQLLIPCGNLEEILWSKIKLQLENQGVRFVHEDAQIVRDGKYLRVGANRYIEINNSRVICATPPSQSPSLFDKNYIRKCKYDKYISFSFVWKSQFADEFHKDIAHLDTYFPETEMDLVYIAYSFNVLSVSVTNSDYVAMYSPTFEQTFVDEIIRELNLTSIQNHFVVNSYDDVEISGFAKGTEVDFVPFETRYPNVFSVGTHNGHSSYPFTSMESAVENAMEFVGVPRQKIIWTLNLVLLVVLITFFIPICVKIIVGENYAEKS